MLIKDELSWVDFQCLVYNYEIYLVQLSKQMMLRRFTERNDKNHRDSNQVVATEILR